MRGQCIPPLIRHTFFATLCLFHKNTNASLHPLLWDDFKVDISSEAQNHMLKFLLFKPGTEYRGSWETTHVIGDFCSNFLIWTLPRSSSISRKASRIYKTDPDFDFLPHILAASRAWLSINKLGSTIETFNRKSKENMSSIARWRRRGRWRRKAEREEKWRPAMLCEVVDGNTNWEIKVKPKETGNRYREGVLF